MSMKNPNPDEQEHLRSEEITSDNTIDLELEDDTQDQTETRPAIVLPSPKSPGASPSPTSDKPEEVSSLEHEQPSDEKQPPATKVQGELKETTDEAQKQQGSETTVRISEEQKRLMRSAQKRQEEFKAQNQNTTDKQNSNEPHQQDRENNSIQKSVAAKELVPLTPDVVHLPTQQLKPDIVHLPTQQLTSKAVAEPVKRQGSRKLQREQVNLSIQPTRGLVPSMPVGSSVRTPATLQAARAQRHKKLLMRHLSRKHIRLGRVEEQRDANRFWGSIFTTIAIVIILFVGLAGGGSYAAYSFYTSTQAQYNAKILDLHGLMPGDNLKMYDRNNILIGQDISEGLKTTVPLNAISPLLKKATIDTEDKNFYSNPGIDVTRIMQSALDDLRSNRVVAGGSTITQQLIKNLILGQEQTFQRKLAEITLVPEVNSHYTKDDILAMYLNSNYYGEQAYGVDAAATMYFGLVDQDGKSAASQLDLAQSALLAGLPSSPVAYDPLMHPQAALTRFKVVLNAMMNSGDITRVQELDALNEEQQPGFFKSAPNLTNRAPHFYDFLMDQLKQQYHMSDKQIARSDMKVYTTLDINIQDKIQKIAQDQIAALAGRNVTNAAEVLIDFHTGAIITMLGSLDYYDKANNGQYNVATQAYRQPGSSFKPYVYATAFADGMSPGAGIADTPLSIKISDTETFNPHDADNETHGLITIRCALQNSKNIPAVRTLQAVGLDNAMQTAKNMGLASYDGYPGYSLVLGGLGVHLLDHTSAYGTFANGGVHVPYYGVEKVVFASTGKVDQHKQDPGTRAISPQLAYMMTNVLSDNTDRLPEFKTCNMLQLYSNSQNQCWAGNPGDIRPTAAKTGTTNNFVDNWTMGYTTDYVIGVWVGNNNDTPMNVVYGVDGAGPIFHYSMLAAEEGQPIRDFTNPGGLQTATVQYPDGVRSTDLYLAGQNPNQAASNPMNQILSPKGAGGVSHYCPNS